MLTEIKRQNVIRLSQSHLNIFEKCPRQFQHIYLEKLASISAPEQQENLTWGKNFHLLMQQRELGLNLDNFLAENSEMSHYFHGLLKAAPELFITQENDFREAEHSRVFELNGYLFTVIYDLLITNQKQAHIIDWKTHLRPPKQEKLSQNWQTRLYLYALVNTSSYLPEQISFTYWFVKTPNKPSKFTINYDSNLHKKNHQDLTQLLTRLDENLENYFQNKTNFIHLKSNQKCSYCESLNLKTNLSEAVFQLLNDDSFYIPI
jgi:PD-(D/E)XK nuclease superfamily